MVKNLDWLSFSYSIRFHECMAGDWGNDAYAMDENQSAIANFSMYDGRALQYKMRLLLNALCLGSNHGPRSVYWRIPPQYEAST